MLKNKCLDKLRLIKPVVDVETLKSIGLNPEISFDYNERLVEVRKVMNLLPEKQKLIMQMRDIDGFTFEEIALLSETSVNNVRVQLCNARKWVKNELTKIYSYGLSKD